MKKLLTKMLADMRPVDVVFLAMMVALFIVLVVTTVLITTFIN